MRVFQPTPPRDQPLESQTENAVQNSIQHAQEPSHSESEVMAPDLPSRGEVTVENATSSEADDYIEVESTERDDKDLRQDAYTKGTPNDTAVEEWYWERNTAQVHHVSELEDSENIRPSVQERGDATDDSKEETKNAMVPVVETVDETEEAPLNTELAVIPETNVQALALVSPSRFRFYMDEQNVPTELSEMETKTLQRRREFGTSIHDLECKIAQLTARLAHERMDREQAMHNALRDNVFEPMEQILERLSYIHDAHDAAKDKLTWMSLERRLTQLDSNFTHCVNVGLQDTKRTQLDSLHDQLVHDVTSDLKLEANKADKREGSMVRRFEGMVGTMARRLQEESAARVAAIEMTSQQLKEISEIDMRRADGFLTTIQQLRAKIKQERVERQAQDQRILDRIVQTTSTMRRAVLETFHDPDVGDEKPRLKY